MTRVTEPWGSFYWVWLALFYLETTSSLYIIKSGQDWNLNGSPGWPQAHESPASAMSHHTHVFVLLRIKSLWKGDVTGERESIADSKEAEVLPLKQLLSEPRSATIMEYLQEYLLASLFIEIRPCYAVQADLELVATLLLWPFSNQYSLPSIGACGIIQWFTD